MDKKIIIIAVAVIALILLGVVFLIGNSVFGNPVSASIASSRIQDYVQTNYPNQDFEIPKARYNFKTNAYVSVVQSQSSRDTRFSVSWRDGTIEDSYEFEVAGRFTTYRRLQEEFNRAVKDIIQSQYPHPVDLCYADFAKNEGDFSSLDLDMPLDIHNPPLTSSLTIWFDSEDLSYDVMAERLREVHSLMQRRAIPMDTYTVRLFRQVNDKTEEKKPGDDLYVMDFPASQIEQDDLANALREHQEEFERLHNRGK